MSGARRGYAVRRRAHPKEVPLTKRTLPWLAVLVLCAACGSNSAAPADAGAGGRNDGGGAALVDGGGASNDGGGGALADGGGALADGGGVAGDGGALGGVFVPAIDPDVAVRAAAFVSGCYQGAV